MTAKKTSDDADDGTATEDVAEKKAPSIERTHDVLQITSVSAKLDELNAFFNRPQIKNELHWFTHRDTLVRAVEWDDRSLLYIEQNGSIIGGLMVWCRSRVLPDGVAQIRMVAVGPEFRRNGIGDSLIAAAMDFAATHEQSIMRADVAAESPAVAFWQALEFEITEEYETASGRTMYITKRPIPQSA